MAYSPPKYPASIPDHVTDLPDRTDDIDWIEAWIYNYVKKELVAVMTELGADPAGTEATVAARLTAIEAAGVDESVILNIYLNSFRIAILGSYAVMNMVKGISDEYEDETGIDTGASENEDYDSENDLYSPSAGAAKATGGTITYDENYVIHTFTENGTFEPNSSFNVETLVIAGGGGGGSNHAGGGGAGGLLYDAEHAVTAKEYSIIVGAGGAGGSTDSDRGDNGSDSVFDDKTADGGGGGGNRHTTLYDGLDGGSGGGGGGDEATQGTGGTGTGGQGYDGGDAYAPSQGAASSGGGGGGAGGIGANGASYDGGAGGIGVAKSISGSAITYAVGGEGGDNSNTGTRDTEAGAGGGGGAGATGAGTDGLTGVVVIKYLGGGGNMTLISEKFTADEAPDEARIIIFEEDVDEITLNTDIKAYASRDDGANWTQITLTDEGDYSGSKRILTGTADISGQPSSTDMVYKIESLNEKDLNIHGAALSWA